MASFTTSQYERPQISHGTSESPYMYWYIHNILKAWMTAFANKTWLKISQCLHTFARYTLYMQIMIKDKDLCYGHNPKKRLQQDSSNDWLTAAIKPFYRLYLSSINLCMCFLNLN